MTDAAVQLALAAAMEADAARMDEEAELESRYRNHEALNAARRKSAAAYRTLAASQVGPFGTGL